MVDSNRNGSRGKTVHLSFKSSSGNWDWPRSKLCYCGRLTMVVFINAGLTNDA